jgi:hypothetical protein
VVRRWEDRCLLLPAGLFSNYASLINSKRVSTLNAVSERDGEYQPDSGTSRVHERDRARSPKFAGVVNIHGVGRPHEPREGSMGPAGALPLELVLLNSIFQDCTRTLIGGERKPIFSTKECVVRGIRRPFSRPGSVIFRTNCMA